jgi:hypothetical protein
LIYEPINCHIRQPTGYKAQAEGAAGRQCHFRILINLNRRESKMTTEIKVAITIGVVIIGVFLFDTYGEKLGYWQYGITAVEVLILMYVWRWSDRRKPTK